MSSYIFAAPCGSWLATSAAARSRASMRYPDGAFTARSVKAASASACLFCSESSTALSKAAPASPAAHRSNDQQRAGDDVDRIAVPQLFELVATYVLVDFIK